MDVREKLVELLKEAKKEYEHISNFNAGITNPEEFVIELIANHLIAHGVTVQECVEKGCDICNGIKPLLLETDIGYTWIVKGKMENAYGDCKIRYCPMCGRELPQPPKGE